MSRGPTLEAHRKNGQNRMHQHLVRDIPSIKFENSVSATGLRKVHLIDKTRNHREVAYVGAHDNINEAKNELAISFMIKFGSEFDSLRLALPSKWKFN